ncbi:MAG: sortase [Patescibacteria group bacterium]|jgi:LPXTG-site transpeptidase (sortase) family protein
MKHKLTEEDLEKIFISSRFKKRNLLAIIISFLAVFISFFLLIAYVLNFSAVNKKIAWWYQDEFGVESHKLQDAVVKIQSGSTSSGTSALPEISDNSIFIESVNVKAPITFDVENSEKPVSSNLKNGVIQIKNTSKPGEIGNVFITGHSSNYPWVKSQYNSIFALLSNVVVGDLVQIRYLRTNYIYRVNNIFVVDPSDTSVLKSDSTVSILTLMTCTPVGTNLNRLIVQAQQIIPDPGLNKNVGSTGRVSIPSGIK